MISYISGFNGSNCDVWKINLPTRLAKINSYTPFMPPLQACLFCGWNPSNPPFYLSLKAYSNQSFPTRIQSLLKRLLTYSPFSHKVRCNYMFILCLPNNHNGQGRPTPNLTIHLDPNYVSDWCPFRPSANQNRRIKISNTLTNCLSLKSNSPKATNHPLLSFLKYNIKRRLIWIL